VKKYCILITGEIKARRQVMKQTLKMLCGLGVALITIFIIDGIKCQVCALEKKGPEPKTVIMDRITLHGKIERPEAVYIIDITNPEFKPIRMERSYHDELLDPVDKDEFEQEVKGEEKPKK
jgi:hypothetical protein